MICYWGVMLELLSAIIEIQESVATKVIAPNADMARKVVKMCQGMEGYGVEAEEVAELLVQGLPYLECCLEGKMGARLPKRVVGRFWERRRRGG